MGQKKIKNVLFLSVKKRSNPQKSIHHKHGCGKHNRPVVDRIHKPHLVYWILHCLYDRMDKEETERHKGQEPEKARL